MSYASSKTRATGYLYIAPSCCMGLQYGQRDIIKYISLALESYLVFRPVLAVPVQLYIASSQGESGQVRMLGIKTSSHGNPASPVVDLAGTVVPPK